MRSYIAALLGAGVLTVITLVPAASKKSDEPAAEGKALVVQTRCPVMGEKIIPGHYVDYKGLRIFYCCEGCRGPLEKDPEKYLKKLEAMGEKAIPVPLTDSAGAK